MTSWKTTTSGLAAVLASIASAVSLLTDNDPATNPDWTLVAAAVSAGFGLMFARDNNKTSEDVGAAPANLRPAPPGAGRTYLLLLGAVLLLPGCATTLETPGPYNGDAALYQADLTITTSKAVLQTFVSWEKDNRAALAQWPEISAAANEIRFKAKTWISSAIALREAYSRAPSPDARSALERALTTLREAVTHASNYFVTYGSRSHPDSR